MTTNNKSQSMTRVEYRIREKKRKQFKLAKDTGIVAGAMTLSFLAGSVADNFFGSKTEALLEPNSTTVLDVTSENVSTINGKKLAKKQEKVEKIQTETVSKETANEVVQPEVSKEVVEVVQPETSIEVATTESISETVESKVAPKETVEIETSKETVTEVVQPETFEEVKDAVQPQISTEETIEVVVEEEEVIKPESSETITEEVVIEEEEIQPEPPVEETDDMIVELPDGSHFFDTSIDYGTEEEVEEKVEEGTFIGIDPGPESKVVVVTTNGERIEFSVHGEELWNVVNQLQNGDTVSVKFTEENGNKVVSSLKKVEELEDNNQQEEVEDNEVDVEGEVKIQDFRGFFSGRGDNGHFQATVDGNAFDFYHYGNEEVTAIVEGLTENEDILIHYTVDEYERKIVQEIISLAEEREASAVIKGVNGNSIEVNENGVVKTYQLWDDKVNSQAQYPGAEATLFIVKKDGVEYVKAVSVDVEFKTATFLSSDEETVTVSVGNRTITCKITEVLKNNLVADGYDSDDLDWEFNMGDSIKIEFVEGDEFHLTRIQKA